MQMEFERPKMSNARAIIATSLVALLAVTISRVKQMDRDGISRAIASAKAYVSVSRFPAFGGPRRSPSGEIDPRNPDEILDSIAQGEDQLRVSYNQWKATGKMPPSNEIEPVANQLHVDFQSLARKENVPEATKRQANMLALSGYFLSGEMAPQTGSPLFEAFVADLLNQARNPAEVRHIRLLSFFHAHPVWQDNDSSALQTLETFARETQDIELIIEVFDTAAAELESRGREHLAEQVARAGFQTIRGHPRGYILRNRMIDLQAAKIQ